MTAAVNQAAFAAVMIPGAREPGLLTHFISGGAEILRVVPTGPSTMSAAVVTQRQREGGGGEQERRLPAAGRRWRLLRWFGL